MCQTAGRRTFLPRGSTHTIARRPGTWFGKPARLAPAVCAAHGWTNTGMDTLTCQSCGATLAHTSSERLVGADADAAAAQLEEQLRTAHTAYCIWHSHEAVGADLIAFPSAQPALVCDAFAGRVEELAALDGLPALGGLGLAVLAERCLPQLLAVLDATAVPVQVRVCHACLRREAVRNVEPRPSAAHLGRCAEGARIVRLAATEAERHVQAPSSENGSASVQGGAEEARELRVLARRPCAFSQAAKVIAALGWRLKPLHGTQPSEDGLRDMADCMLRCPTCCAAVGLWSHAPAPATQGTLGTGGLLGQWGAGSGVAKPKLQTMSIAGGVDGTAANGSGPWQSAGATPVFGVAGARGSFGSSISHSAASNRSSGSLAEEPHAVAAAQPQAAQPFGSGKAEAPFGATVCLSEVRCAKSPAAGLAAGAGAGVAVGAKRRRSDGDVARENKAKAAKIISEVFDESLKDGDAARLRDAGLPIAKGAFDPVLSHRSWCAPRQLARGE